MTVICMNCTGVFRFVGNLIETELRNAGGILAIEYYHIELKNGERISTCALN